MAIAATGFETCDKFGCYAVGYSLGLKADGSIVAWGDNFYGQCNVPPPNAGFVAVAVWWTRAFGLKADGSIMEWPAVPPSGLPSPNTGFVDIAGGFQHNLGLKANGSIVAWGHNYWGQCNVPPPNTGFVAVAAGFSHSLGLKADAPCYPDCNADGALTVADFGCFQTKFVLGDLYADCNGQGGLTVADFGCFQTKFVLGCP